MTSKLQVTVPKAIADQYGIRPGDDIEWVAAGDSIRVVPEGRKQRSEDEKARLKNFDQATARQFRRRGGKIRRKPPRERGWRREDLYDRGQPR